MEITEKWLGDIGGWQAMKAAREYVRLNSVSGAVREGNVFTGLVGSGQRAFKATLVVNDRSRVDCKCGCPDARRGLICAHGLAVALAVISPPASAPPSSLRSVLGGSVHTSPPNSPPSIRTSQKENTSSAGKAAEVLQLPEDKVLPGAFSVYISTERLGRVPGGALPVFLRFQPDAATKEVAIASWLKRHGQPQQTVALQLTDGEINNFLETIAGHERVYQGSPNVKNSPRIRIERELRLEYTGKIDNKDQSVHFKSLNDTRHVSVVIDERWIFDGDLFTFSQLPVAASRVVFEFVTEFLSQGCVVRPLKWLVMFMAELRPLLVESEGYKAFATLRVLPADPRFRLSLDGGLRILKGKLSVVIGSETHFPLQQDVASIYPVQDVEEMHLFYVRNRLKEQQAVAELEAAGFKPSSDGCYELKGEDEILKFHASGLPRLLAFFTIEEGDLWRAASRNLSTVRPRLHSRENHQGESSGQDWLSLEVAYESADGFRIPRNEVLRLIRSGKRDMKGKDGRRYILDLEEVEDLEETLQDVGSRLLEGGAALVVQSRQAEALTNYAANPEVLKAESVAPLGEAELARLLGPLAATLRPYQRDGVTWMDRLARMRAGGLLADEMGLGKTVQTLALVRLVLGRREAGDRSPVLVVCPTSLLSNWSEEAAKFTPDLTTHISHESERQKHLGQLDKFDVIFTSYALIVRDLAHYRKTQFAAVVLDEASFIRNPDTATAKAVREVPSKAMFALTGTPVENSVKDLWSIFQFILPGYLPDRDSFQERFVKPLSQPDAPKARAVMERLRRLTLPYVLRRTKREVVKELPEKIEKVLWCELTGPQKEIYQRLLDEGREEIRQARKRTGQGAARMTMFTVLLRLRQTCNDLRLLKMDKTPDELGGKWPMLEEAFTEIVEGGHKALIFSQFVGMLKLIREKAEGMGIDYCYLDGSSKDRGEQVATFQAQANKKLFLISLKAGGYGLNLTAADHVMLVDPWWNPAVEAQAIDRAHRIGQGKTVTAYRLVTRGTVEEKILRLQASKRAIMEMAFDDDSAVMAGVSDDELEEMLR